jgi:tetratricopeptide (TPR) repeat protein
MTMPSTHHGRRHSRRLQTAVFFDLTDTADDAFDRAIEIMLVALLAFAPLALGAVQAWSELIVIGIAAAMALCLAIKLLRRPDVRFVWSWTYVPIVVFLAVTAFQLLPLPLSVLKILSPHTAELKTSLLTSASVAPEHRSAMPLSFYPEGTLHDLRLLLAVATVYVVTLNVVRQARQIQRLLIAITGIGAIVALIAAAHLLLGAHRVYGFIGENPSNWTTAPFLNRNHFGQFMNLSLGVAAAVLLTQLEQFIHGFRRSSLPADQMIGQIPAMIWLAAGAVVVCAVGVFLSLSRGAMISLAVSAALAALVAWRHHLRVRIWVLMPLIWLVLVLVIFFGFDVLAGRFSRLEEHSGAARVQVAKDVIEASKQFPLLGLGQGTFEVTYPMFDRSNWASLAANADNDYAQTLFEVGPIGLATALVFAVMIWRSYGRCVRSAPSPMASSAIGLGFGLFAVLLHSFTDFGQHVPACAALSAVCCALLLTLTEASRQIVPTAQPEVLVQRRGAARPAWRAVALLVVVGAGYFVTNDAWARARAEWSWFEVRYLEPTIANRNWQADDNEYYFLLTAARRASDLAPADVHYRHWLNYYRWRLISQWRDPISGEILMTPQDIEQKTQWANQIVRELLGEMWRCPTYGPSYLLAGQIEKSMLGHAERGAELIRIAYRLSQNDPEANFEAAILDAQDGTWDAALEKFRHAAALSPQYMTEGVDTLTATLHRPDLALQLAGGDIPAVREIMRVLQSSGDTATATQVRTHLKALIQDRAAPSDASSDALADAGEMMMEEKDYAAASAYYRRALNLNVASPQLHLDLAQALAGQGLREDAIDEARTASRLGSRAAEGFILELRQKPASGPATKAAEAPASRPR